jgi:hypothetical protein
MAAQYSPTTTGPCGNGWVGNMIQQGFKQGEGYQFVTTQDINFQYNLAYMT